MTTWRWSPPENERDVLIKELREAKAEIASLNKQVAESAEMLQRLRDHIYDMRQQLHHAQAQTTPELPCPCSKCSKPWNWRETR
jgi:septal ring factor EnvC (AmiA/AmiB activator)